MTVPREDRAWSPKKDAELLRIEIYRKLLRKQTGRDVSLIAIPDETEVNHRHRPCDAILKEDQRRLAVELTTIDSFVDQRLDDDRFRRVMGTMEERIGAIPDWVEVTIDVRAIPTGYDWYELSSGIETWLLSHLQILPYERHVPVQIPGIPFTVGVRREQGRGNGRIVVMRRAPSDLEEQRCTVLRRALESKRDMLRHYRSEGYAAVLLLETYDVALANRDLICETFKKISPMELCADAIDEVYLIETDTRPWAISPLKVGSQIFNEASPQWPNAPGYPFLDIRQT